jgi:hypothetical protein
MRLVIGVLARTDRLHLVIAGLQRVDQAPEGHRDAVDFGRIGFGHHRDAQLRAHRRQGLAGEFDCIHAAQHVRGMRQRDETSVTVW